MSPISSMATLPARHPARSCRAASFWQVLRLLTLATWVVVLLQGFVLFPLVEHDPLFVDLDEPAALQRTFWMLRLLALCLAPVVLAMRAVTLSVLLHAVLGGRTTARLRELRLALLRAEAIFVFESACTTLLLIVQAPDSLRAAEALRLRAGLDLLWQPDTPGLAAWIASMNIFVLWWADRVRIALAHIYGLGRAASMALAALLAVILIIVRAVLLPT